MAHINILHLSNKLLIIVTLIFLATFTLIINLIIDNQTTNDLIQLNRRSERSSSAKLTLLESSLPGDHRNPYDKLKLRIEDLERIKSSIRNELKLIQREKLKLLKEKANLVLKNEKINNQINKSKAQLKQLDLDISANRRQKFEKTCDSYRIAPIVFKPLKSVDIEDENYSLGTKEFFESAKDDKNNHILFGFDLSLCPLTREFKFYLQTTDTKTNSQQNGLKYKISPETMAEYLLSHRQYTSNISDACLIIHLTISRNSRLQFDLSKNNLVIDILMHNQTEDNRYPPNVAVASSSYKSFRNGFDILLPSVLQPQTNQDSIIGTLPPYSPIDRKYLAAYLGSGEDYVTNGSRVDRNIEKIERVLQVIHKNSYEDSFAFIYNCPTDISCISERESIIESSTFFIIPFVLRKSYESNYQLLYLSLASGTIPVIVSSKAHLRLPFDEVIDWRRCAIILEFTRLPEVHLLLRSIGPSDIYKMKYFGRRLFENYLATTQQIIDTTISVISLERFGQPPSPVREFKTKAHNSNYKLQLDVNCTAVACMDYKTDSIDNRILSYEMLGPREKPFASPTYRRNMSLVLSSSYDLWNNPMYTPFKMYPSHPNDPISPSEFKYLSPDQGYRPINEGLGGSGNEFSQSLGGDQPNEQFTVVILTHERQNLLMKTLERLKGTAYMNKIIVVWNDLIYKPRQDLLWPDVGVPIVVVEVERNSLNNRFLPYDAIETEAVFSMDDDSPLRPDEIVFAFRVWRQSRDRIVGFPGRYHAWDNDQNTWLYNSNHSCELSMVLTGGAFFHKYYTYLYSHEMPEAIRSMVDRFMNCEDIAMNFLVAHMTRQPPIKVTSRWTFHCSGCTSSLSEDDSHFRERHECLNTFASIYGYMPLLTTQHRSDSILFKTRLPQNKQKCFKFV